MLVFGIAPVNGRVMVSGSRVTVSIRDIVARPSAAVKSA